MINIWEDIDMDTYARIQDVKDVHEKIISAKKCC